MATEKRLIDANAYPCQNCEVSYCYKNCEKFNAWFNKTVGAMEVVHGWTEVIEPFKVTLTTRCGLCGVAMGNLDNYCPNCGAKMDGERRELDA